MHSMHDQLTMQLSELIGHPSVLMMKAGWVRSFKKMIFTML